jgi:hypothetical protein
MDVCEVNREVDESTGETVVGNGVMGGIGSPTLTGGAGRPDVG